MPPYDITLLTEARYENPAERDWYVENIFLEDDILRAAIERRGLRVARVDWASASFDWSQTRGAMFRTTWDYFFRIHEFRAWLDRVEPVVHLFNSAEQVRWNLDKHYLLDLNKRGVNIPPTRVAERGERVSLERILSEFDAAEAVVKPLVSGAARHTYRIARGNNEEIESIVNGLLRVEAMMVQPLQYSVLKQGELSLMVISGHYTHAVQKIAKPGDFRVHDDYGGKVLVYKATSAEIDFAEQAVAACPGKPLYARVDLIRDNEGRLAVMELELIEPELFFRHHPPAAEELAAALAERL